MTDSLPFHMLRIMKSRPYSWSLWKVPLSCIPPPGALLKETILYSKKHEFWICPLWGWGKQEVLITTITLENSSKNTGYFWKPRLFCIGLIVMNWLEVPLKDKKINILVQVIHWYFQPIIYIRLLSSLEQVTNFGFGQWQLSISVVPFLV